MSSAYTLYILERNDAFLIGDTLPIEERLSETPIKQLYAKGPFSPVGSPEMEEIIDINEWIKNWEYCGFEFSWNTPFIIPEKETESTGIQNLVIFVPMSNLYISNEPPINGEWKVADVNFISKEVAHKREDNEAIKHSHAPAFAIIEKKDSAKNTYKSIFKTVNNAKNILIASHAFLFSRSAHINCSIFGYPDAVTLKCNILNKDTGGIISYNECDRTLSPININGEWLASISDTTWLISLFEILTSSTVDYRWKMEIYRAAETIGRSLGALDRSNALFLNVIAMEILLTHPGERNAKKLTDRFECIFSWLGESKPDFSSEIKNIYDARHKVIHEGDYSKISTALIHLSDCYAHNALINVVSNVNNFKSKNDFIVKMEGYNKSGCYPCTLKSQWFDYPFKSHLDGLSLW